MSTEILTAFAGILGVVFGILLNEYIRKRNRVEIYSKEVFFKKMSIYDELYKTLNETTGVAREIIENPDYSKEERHAIWSEVVLGLAAFCDENALYLNEEITVHCMMTLMGVEELYYIEDPEDKRNATNKYFIAIAQARKLIRKEIGLEAVDKLFGSITKAKPKSKYISYYQAARKELKK